MKSRRHDILAWGLFFKMTSNQKAAEIVKLIFKTISPRTVMCMVTKKYPDDARLTKLQMHRLVITFQQNGSVEDSRKKIMVY